MKLFKSIATIVMLLICILGKTQNEFVTVWKTDISDEGIPLINNQIKLSMDGIEMLYWENVNDPKINSTLYSAIDPVINFPSPGTYRIKIRAHHSGLNMKPILWSNGDNYKLIRIEQWGTGKFRRIWLSGAKQMEVTATDIPDLTNTILINAFVQCLQMKTIPNVDKWNLSTAKDLQYMFAWSGFNGPIENWDVSGVENFYSMFKDNHAFNRPIGIWNMNSAKSLSSMFENATEFNQNIENWNVGSVVSMSALFKGAVKFNQPLNKWNVKNVTSMESVFEDARSFNQPLNGWNVDGVSNYAGMRYMFKNAINFNQPLHNWNVFSVRDMSSMFEGASSFNQPLNTWNVRVVQNMSRMFKMASSFNQPLSTWDVSYVGAEVGSGMTEMFKNATNFNQSLESWNLKRINSFSGVSGMLDSSGLSIENYSKTLIGWSENANTPSNLYLGARPLKYDSTAISPKALLISRGWNITDGGLRSYFTLGSLTAGRSENIIYLTWNVIADDPGQSYVLQMNQNDGSFKTIQTIPFKVYPGRTSEQNMYRIAISKTGEVAHASVIGSFGFFVLVLFLILLRRNRLAWGLSLSLMVITVSCSKDSPSEQDGPAIPETPWNPEPQKRNKVGFRILSRTSDGKETQSNVVTIENFDVTKFGL
jgi:hypothetical protein